MLIENFKESKCQYARVTFQRNTAWGAGEQLTITVCHHYKGAVLTVTLMFGKRILGSCVARVTGRTTKFYRKLLLFRM